jgi:hypothetical protein
MRSNFLWAIAGLLFFCYLSPGRAAVVNIPGTSVSMEAPPGFTVSEGFSGLENAESEATIMITEFPAKGYEEMLPLFQEGNKKFSEFMTINGRKTLMVEGRSVPLIFGRQTSQGAAVKKYLALLRGEVTVLVTFNIFDEKALADKGVEATIMSIRLSKAAKLEEKLDELPFSFAEVAPFRAKTVIAGSGVSLTTFEETDPTGLLPLVIIAFAGDSVKTADPSLIAVASLRSIEDFNQAEIRISEPKKFAGAVGHYLEAVAGNRTIVQFITILPNQRYIRLVAYGETEAFKKVLPAVLEIAESVEVDQVARE